MNILAKLFIFFGIIYSFNLSSQSTVEYGWPNSPCSNILNCINGCSSCNLPINSDSYFFGTNAVWAGVDYCPHPVISGDNAVGTEGWGMFPDSSKYVLISCVSSLSINVDSIFIRSASLLGPTRYLVSISINGGSFQPIYDTPTYSNFDEICISSIGGVQNLGAFATFQIKIQAYGFSTGTWFLDNVKIVATPNLSIGIVEMDHSNVYDQVNYPYFDLLGREIIRRPFGFYLKNKLKQ